jgi:hypothetical protein
LGPPQSSAIAALHCLPAQLSPARLPRQAGGPAEKDFREWELVNLAQNVVDDFICSLYYDFYHVAPDRRGELKKYLTWSGSENRRRRKLLFAEEEKEADDGKMALISCPNTTFDKFILLSTWNVTEKRGERTTYFYK